MRYVEIEFSKKWVEQNQDDFSSTILEFLELSSGTDISIVQTSGFFTIKSVSKQKNDR